MKKQKILPFILAFTLIFSTFAVASSAKLERYDLTSDQLTYHENARSIAKNIIDSIYGNTFSSYGEDSSADVYDQFLRQVTYFLRRDFVNDPVEKCLYELTLNDISDHGNGKIVHLTATMDLYTANSDEPTVKTLDIFVNFAFVYKVLVATDVYVAENSLEMLLFPEIAPMTLEKFADWADETNEEEYAALAEKLKSETADIIDHYEREIFKDIYHNQNENVSVKNSDAVEAFELAKTFLNEYIACIVEQKTLETTVPTTSEYVTRYLAAMAKYDRRLFEHYTDAQNDFEFICLDSYVYEDNYYLEVQVCEPDSSTVVYFRFTEQDDGTLAIANFCAGYPNFDAAVYDWNSYGSYLWFDSYIQDFKTIDYAEVIDRAEQIAENGYFESDKKLALNISLPAEPPVEYENDYLSNPATADLSLIFYALAVVSAVLSCVTFKKKA